MWRSLTVTVAAFSLSITSDAHSADWKMQLRSQVETKPQSGRFHTAVRRETWKPSETAIILCDFWDLHHCRNAVRRMEEFGPRLNEVLKKAREAGVTIVHAPSDCMPAYSEHPARARASAAPKAQNAPPEIELWYSRIPAEERASYPIDQSDGGEDDDPAEHAEWAAKLSAMGRNPNMPWKRQSDMIAIDGDRDYLSDRGDEVWNVLEQRGIRNVILAGVHTNMCVLGRPFGLRQMVRGGKNVVLLRDMTDTMYNPARWPWVSHFTANDLIISHIERHVCPTITSDQILGGKPFRFAGDKRPHLAMVIAENGYDTGRTLPRFAMRQLGSAFRVSLVHGSETDPHELPGLDVLSEADVALFSVRRRALKPEQMAIVRRFIDAGKPVIGIRTASHAFSLKDRPVPEGSVTWETFDADVFGGHYHGHPGAKTPAKLRIAGKAASSPLLTGIPNKPFETGGSLYLTSPLARGTDLLVTGGRDDAEPEPVAWTFKRKDGGKSFYTSLGEPADFESPEFQRLLRNASYWAAGLAVPQEDNLRGPLSDYAETWAPFPVPATLREGSSGFLKKYRGPVWYRCVVRVPTDWKGKRLTIEMPIREESAMVWWNGQHAFLGNEEGGRQQYSVDPDGFEAGEANLIVVRFDEEPDDGGMTLAPTVSNGKQTISLKGRWQLRLGDDKAWKNMPLPAKFGASTDVIFERQP